MKTNVTILILMLISILTFAQPTVTYNLNNEVTVDISNYTANNFPGYVDINRQTLGIILQWYNHPDSTKMIIESIPDATTYNYNINNYSTYKFDTLTIITYINYKLYDGNYGIYNHEETDTTLVTINNIHKYFHETINLTNTIQIDSTIYDTTYTDVYDTNYIHIPITKYDTTYITITDTSYTFESITQTDTINLTETITSLTYIDDLSYTINNKSIKFSESHDIIYIYNINGQLLQTYNNTNYINFEMFNPNIYILFIPNINPIKLTIRP
jgi:hypothetical protein